MAAAVATASAGERLCCGRSAARREVRLQFLWLLEPLSSSTKTLNPGLSEHCEQQDSWRREPDQQYRREMYKLDL